MAARIVVINPNSTAWVTQTIERAIHDALPADVEVTVLTSTRGPAVIEDAADAERATPPMVELALGCDADAYVVACFTDMGIDALAAAVGRPVFGIGTSAIRLAREHAATVGVLSTTPRSSLGHETLWQRLGWSDVPHLDRPVGHPMLGLTRDSAVRDCERVAVELVEAGTGCVVLGCTGMSHLKDRLTALTGVPVIEPCAAALRYGAGAVLAQAT